jgi:predicted RNase H-like HicB family nuclease
MLCELTAVYEPQEDGQIRAYVLEVPGTWSYGKTMEEARTNLAELLRLTLNSYRLNLLQRASKQAVLEALRLELPTLPATAEQALALAAGLKTRTFTPDDVKRALFEEGVLAEITPPLPPSARREEHGPIPIEGRPISEEIIEGRR